jgi:hypothetical protein
MEASEAVWRKQMEEEMCPVCMSTAAIVVSGGAFTGGLSSLLVGKALFWGRDRLSPQSAEKQDGATVPQETK